MLTQLPFDIQSEIFSWLSNSDLHNRCRFLNKQLNKLALVQLGLNYYKNLSTHPSQLAKFLLTATSQKTFPAYYQFLFSQTTDFTSLENFYLSNKTTHFSSQTARDSHTSSVTKRLGYLEKVEPIILEKKLSTLIKVANNLQSSFNNQGDKFLFKQINLDAKIKLGHFLYQTQKIEEVVVLLGLFEVLNTHLNIYGEIDKSTLGKILLVPSLAPAISCNTLLALHSWIGSDLPTMLYEIANGENQHWAKILYDKLIAAEPLLLLSEADAFIHQNFHMQL